MISLLRVATSLKTFRNPPEPSPERLLARDPAFAELSRRNQAATRLAAQLFVEEGQPGARAVQLALRHHPAFRRFENKRLLREVRAVRDALSRTPAERALAMDRACINLLAVDFQRPKLRQQLVRDPALRWYDVLDILPEHLRTKLGFFDVVNLLP